MIKFCSRNSLSLLIAIFLLTTGFNHTMSQEITGKVIESVTLKPVYHAVITVSATGEFTETDSMGNFSLAVPNNDIQISVFYPGFHQRNFFLHGRENITVSLVPVDVRSLDNEVKTPLGTYNSKNMSNSVTSISSDHLEQSVITSIDQALQGTVPGVHVVSQGGLPGLKSWVNIKGLSSFVASNEPIVMIDGVMHLTNYADRMLIDGYTYNPLDIVDVADIASISVISDGASYLGSSGANGIININTERESETSTSILVNAYTGMSLRPAKKDVLGVGQFKQYFTSQLQSQGLSNEQINSTYPWLNGGENADEYFRYNNNTNWQNEIFKQAILQKYHIFLKGGDDIATYNVSTGYLKHQGPFDGSAYSRYNLRINGRINITERFSVAPNVKLSLSDTYVPEQGGNTHNNPILASLLKPPLMAPYVRDEKTGQTLPKLDDVGAFNTSNPVAIIEKGTGESRNYHFMSSARLNYRISKNLSVENITGLDYNNAREDIFIPDVGLASNIVFGVASTDELRNSPRSMVNEYRSTQNHTSINYTLENTNRYFMKVKAGTRILSNKYQFDKGIDYNTPTDDFTSLGDGGSESKFLRVIDGENRSLNWIAYYGSVDFNFRNKYYIRTNASVDGSSLTNKNNRYSFYPSVNLAWRISSEDFMLNSNLFEDLKLRLGWSNSGNMYTSIFDLSKLYYTHRRINKYGVLVRESIPNEDLVPENKMVINAGVDASMYKQALNIHVNYYVSMVNNLIIPQNIPDYYGLTDFYDNGGVMQGNGLELAIEGRFNAGQSMFQIGGTFNMLEQKIKELDYILPPETPYVTNIGVAEFILEEGLPINTFYGFETIGIYGGNTDVVGPNGQFMKAGDIKYDDKDGNKIINDADKTEIGDPNPDFFGGLSGSWNYKRFELNTHVVYSIGNDIFNYTKLVSQSMDSYANQSTDILNRWPQGNEIPRASIDDPTGNTVFSDRWIEDGSYMKLKYLTLKYKIPKSNAFYKDLVVYITATNIFTLTKYSGYDPEFFYMNDPFYMGVDYGKIPETRSFILGVKLEL